MGGKQYSSVYRFDYFIWCDHYSADYDIFAPRMNDLRIIVLHEDY